MYQLRFIINKHNFEIIDTYPNYILAYGMKKKKAALEPQTYPLHRLIIVKV